MDQLDIAIHQTAHNAKGGMDALAKRLGMVQGTLYNKVNPHTETHKLNIHELRAMMLDTGDSQVLDVLAAEVGRTILPVAKTPSGSLVACLLKVVAEGGDLSRAFEEASRDNDITPREKASLLREIQDLEEAAATLKLKLIGSK